MVKFIVKLVAICIVVIATDYAISAYLENGLVKHYGFNNGAKILCIGHSRSDHGIDKERLEQGLNVPVAKYVTGGMDTFDRLTMIHHYFSEHPNSVKVVVYDVDFFSFNGRTVVGEEKMKQYMQLYPFIDNVEIDNYIKSKSTWHEYFSKKYIRTLRFNDPNVFARAVINHFKTPQIPETNFDVASYKKDLLNSNFQYRKLVIDSNAVKCFDETIAFLKSKNVKIILLFLPIIDLERDRIDKNYRDKVIDMFRQYAARDADVTFIENTNKYEQLYKVFIDPLHFNKHGQILATDDLVRAIKLIE